MRQNKKIKISSEKLFRQIVRKNPGVPNYIIRKMVLEEMSMKEELLKDELFLKTEVIDSFMGSFENIEIQQSDLFREKIQQLDEHSRQTFMDIYPWVEEDDPINFWGSYLYHGIRFGKQLERLEGIFRLGGIAAGKYLEDCYWYDDVENCNEGEYVSLIEYSDSYSLEYDTFVLPNISLVVSPFCGAVKTLYLCYDDYRRMREEFSDLKNRYSYARGEYQVKDRVPLEMVKAVGVPYRYLKNIGKIDLASQYLDSVGILMARYGIELPIVDTSYYNQVLVNGRKKKSLRK